MRKSSFQHNFMSSTSPERDPSNSTITAPTPHTTQLSVLAPQLDASLKRLDAGLVKFEEHTRVLALGMHRLEALLDRLEGQLARSRGGVKLGSQSAQTETLDGSNS